MYPIHLNTQYNGQRPQIDKRERCSAVPAVKCEPAGPPVQQCRTLTSQQCGPAMTKQETESYCALAIRAMI